MDAQTTLKVESIAKSYGGKKVLHDASLSIDGGKVVGIEGENGAGKSRLLKILSDLLKPDRIH
jgi:ABC-type sugar transport system ATPase subunit